MFFFSLSLGSRDIHLPEVTISAGPKSLIENSELRMSFGRRYGLVGRNGSGKTTLLRHIAGRDIKGIPSNIQILHVEQEAIGDDTPVLDSVLAADAERDALVAEERQLLAGVQNPDSEMRLSQVYAQLQEIDADGSKAR